MPEIWNCPHCGRETYRNLETCPHCGEEFDLRFPGEIAQAQFSRAEGLPRGAELDEIVRETTSPTYGLKVAGFLLLFPCIFIAFGDIASESSWRTQPRDNIFSQHPWLFLVVAVAGTATMVWLLVSGRPKVILDRRGVTRKGFFGSEFWAWSTLQRFRLESVETWARGIRIVHLELRSGLVRIHLGSTREGKTSESGERFCARVNAWRDRYGLPAKYQDQPPVKEPKPYRFRSRVKS